MPWTDLSRPLATGLLLITAMACPAIAASEPSTRLISCGDESCLLISGVRDDRAAPVQINGRFVPVEGGRHWRARLPMTAVRLWSAPYARTITVSINDAATDARLPIGLLGKKEDLAFLTVRVK